MSQVDAAWYALVVVGVVIVDRREPDDRLVARSRARFSSAALESNALHFFSDLLGSAAVLVGLLFVRAGYQHADSIAALFVAALVLVAADAPDAHERRRAHGPRAGRGRGGRARRDRGDHARSSTSSACACARPAGASSPTS